MPTTETREQLNRILAHPQFEAAPQLRSFLRYIVSEATAGNADRIKAYSIATEALGRDASFDPIADPIVRVQAGRLRKLLEAYNSADGRHDSIRITVPKGSYIPQIDRLDTKAGEALSQVSGGCSRGAALERPFVAIFPCEPVYSKTWQDGFCETMAEEILVGLSKFQTIDTLPITSMMNAMRESSDPRTCGSRVGADLVLESRFFSDGPNTQLFVKLIAVETGGSIWSHRFDLDLTPDNLVTLRQQMADEISTLIAEPFGYAHRSATWRSQRANLSDLNAYECFLQAHLYELSGTGPTFARALTALQRAVDLLPDCGTALAKLSELYCDGYRRGHGGLKATKNYIDLAQEAATRAYQLCSECSSSSMAMARVLFARGKFDEGRKMGEIALAQNPNDYSIKANVGRYISLHDPAGLRLVEEAVTARPIALAPYYLTLGGGHYLASNHRSASKAFEKAESCLPFFKCVGIAANSAELDETEGAEKAIIKLKEHWPNLKRDELKGLLSRSHSDETVGRYLYSLRHVGFAA